jgi:hypothetical protein
MQRLCQGRQIHNPLRPFITTVCAQMIAPWPWHQACSFEPVKLERIFVISTPLVTELPRMRPRISLLIAALAVGLSALSAHAETVVRYGM